MNTAIERVKTAFAHKYQNHVVRGELWLGKQPFKEVCINDDLEGHIRLRNRLGMDIFFLPLRVPDFFPPDMEYRRFGLDEVEEAVGKSDLFIGIIVDGPFQRLVGKKGLMPFLTGLKENEQVTIRSFEQEAEHVEVVISRCLELNVGAVVVADDLAYQQSTYISPDHTAKLIVPVYSRVISMIHSSGAYALFHSCGNITALIPHLITCGFDGLAACQNQCLDLVSIKRIYGAQLTILAGIDADLLEATSLAPYQKGEFGTRIMSLSKEGGFILSSSCGLYAPKAVERLQELYDIAEAYLREHQAHALSGI